jgi:L-ascorbate metabolism protein UlaG (beta-lactamase superfamily)
MATGHIFAARARVTGRFGWRFYRSEPMSPMRDQHINPAEAVQALLDCGAETALASHYGTFQLTDEAIDAPLLALADALKAAGIPPERLRALRPGQVWQMASNAIPMT